MNEAGQLQQIVDKIKSSSNVLVTVSKGPSVDALSAAIGLTVALNKLDKHAVAIMSGEVPPAITFLEPEKTFENNVDSLRDFIIALDKEKADHLRYKVEGDVVKIFITPYRTTISEADLVFSQGDYNVDLVIAIGVNDQNHLDNALASHGRILHDATVVSIENTEPGRLGGIDWAQIGVSSLCEMITQLIDAIPSNQAIMDKQIATALLTGLVAETGRFSNLKTTSQSMALAAKLMGAGADQQLVAARLQDGHAINAPNTTPVGASPSIKDQIQSDGTIKTDGGLVISHASTATLEEISEQVKSQSQALATNFAEQQLEDRLAKVATPVPAAQGQDLQKELKAESDKVGQLDINRQPQMPSENEPMLGGTLSATTELAARESASALEENKNRILLEHQPTEQKPLAPPPFNSSVSPEPPEPHIDLFSGNIPPTKEYAPMLGSDTNVNAMTSQTMPDPGVTQHEDALAAVHAAFESPAPSQPIGATPMTFAPQPTPQFSVQPSPPSPSVLPMPPPLPDFTAMPPPPPSFGNAGTQPPAQTPPNDMNQFRIPGQ